MRRGTQRAVQTVASLILLAGAGYFAYVELWPLIRSKLFGGGGTGGIGASAETAQNELIVDDGATEMAQGLLERVQRATELGASGEGIAAVAETAWPFQTDIELRAYLGLPMNLPTPTGGRTGTGGVYLGPM